MILADVMKRWHSLKGQKSLLLTGTDEHGIKVQKTAAYHDMPPKEWCDMQAEKFKELAAAANISYDFFMRTTDEDHKKAVQYFWRLLQDKGLIYTSKHAGWYCVSDEAFYPENMLTRTIDPVTGEVYMASTETGNRAEWTEEKNYHFRLRAMKDQLLAFYEENPDFIKPRQRMEEAKAWVQNHLEDFSVSRPIDRLDWGIRVPDDQGQTIYVWLDALVNYLTKAGFPNWTPGKEENGGWPADLHVVGKDILRFHAVYWPALLLAVDLPPPKQLMAHAHWTMAGKKMSKSLGNVVDPFRALERWGVDTIRFFMVHDGILAQDSNYENQYIALRYKKLLHGICGNMLSRLQPRQGSDKQVQQNVKSWRVEECVEIARIRAAGATLAEFDPEHRDMMAAQEKVIEQMYEVFDAHMNDANPRGALMHLMEVLSEVRLFVFPASHITVKPADSKCVQTNQFFAKMAPWEMGPKILEADKRTDAVKMEETRAQTVYLGVETLRNLGILLGPFMPSKSKEMLDRLGVAQDRRTIQYVGLGKDFSYGRELEAGYSGRHLFPKLEVDEWNSKSLAEDTK